METNTAPPALAALAAFPHVHDQVERSLAAQARRIAERAALVVPRPGLLRSLGDRIRALSSGLIALEGPLGSGTTTLLCHLAATRPYAFWLPEDDLGGGLEALYGQLLALHGVAVPLVPPAAGRDATALERLLFECGAQRSPGDPLVVLIDRPPDEQAAPIAPPFPAAIPPGVVIVLACAPKAGMLLQAAARVVVPMRGARLEQRLAQAAGQLGCAPAVAVQVGTCAQGSFLYVHLAAGLLKTRMLQVETLPVGLEPLHEMWWSRLDLAGHRLAALVATAG